MKTAFLKSTAAAALVMLSLGAQAAEVTLDFSGLVTGTVPVTVGNSITGFLFSGATAWTTNVATQTNDPKPGNPDQDRNDPYIATRDQSGALTDIEVLLSGTNSGRYVKSVSFNLFVGAAQPYMDAFAGDEFFNSPQLSPGNGDKIWSVKQTKDFAEDDRITRLKFFAGKSGESGLLGLDNLSFDFYGIGEPNPTVPEPASYALVALALLAAGGASRRRKA